MSLFCSPVVLNGKKSPTIQKISLPIKNIGIEITDSLFFRLSIDKITVINRTQPNKTSNFHYYFPLRLSNFAVIFSLMKKLRNENQKYDAWLHWDVTKRCNLDCEYCFGKIVDTNVKIYSIKIEKLISTLDKTGKTFRISFTGGEPTLVPNFVDACKAITEKHYISFNTNLISKSIKQFAKEIDKNRVLHIHASFHYDELLNKNLLDRFVHNYKFLEENGFNIFAEGVAFPKIKSNLEDIKKVGKENSIKLSFAPFYGNFNGQIYPQSYSDEELKLFGISESEISCFTQKGKLCNAGYNVSVVFSNGNVYPCHQIKTKIGNIYEGINFKDELVKCPSRKCGCPLNKYDIYLFEKGKHRYKDLFDSLS